MQAVWCSWPPQLSPACVGWGGQWTGQAASPHPLCRVHSSVGSRPSGTLLSPHLDRPSGVPRCSLSPVQYPPPRALGTVHTGQAQSPVPTQTQGPRATWRLFLHLSSPSGLGTHRHTHSHVHTQVHSQTYTLSHMFTGTHIYTCTHRCTHSYMCTHRYTHIHKCVHIGTHMHIHAHRSTHMSIRALHRHPQGAHAHTPTHVCTHRGTHVYMPAHMYAHRYTQFTCVHTCTHMHHTHKQAHAHAHTPTHSNECIHVHTQAHTPRSRHMDKDTGMSPHTNILTGRTGEGTLASAPPREGARHVKSIGRN